MKRSYIKKPALWMIIVTIMLGSFSCKEKLDENFLNPDGFTDPTVEGFYSNAQTQLGLFRKSYGEYYHTFRAFNGQLGSGGVVNDGAIPTFSWGHAPYGDLFNKLRPLRSMEDVYAKLPADQKTEYAIYMWTGSVMKDFLFSRLTDAYNDVPYSEALKANDGSYFPKFDKQQDIYTGILADLKTVSTNLKTFTLGTSAIQQSFKQQDILFAGDVVKWRVFVNSLRLRLAMRISVANPTLAKSTIQEVYADGQYSKDRATSTTLVDRETDRAMEYLINRGMVESRSWLWAPQKMFDVLRKAGQPEDPRIRVLFQPDKDGNYTAMPTEAAQVQAINAQITNADLSKTFPSIYNRTTFEQNLTLPSLILTSSEVHLILAEAGVRWPDLGINVADEYRQAIQQSIDIYYEINAGNTAYRTYAGFIPASQPAKPSQLVIDAFLVARAAEFAAAGNTEKMGLIFDEKYVHFNMLEPMELWSDTRRLTKELGTRIKKSPTNYRLMERTIYPSSEEQNNFENFKAVATSNNYTSPVWWTGR